MNKNTKKRIQESITNLVNLGVIPADEAQLNTDVIYDSILDEVCSIVPMESPQQVISCLKFIYDSEGKSIVNTGDVEKDAFKLMLMNGVGAVPLNDKGYPTNNVHCTISGLVNNIFIAPYQKIIPGTVVIETKDGDRFTDTENKGIISGGKGNIYYDYGKFEFNDASLEGATLSYKFDIYNLLTNRNFAKFVKKFVEIFADIYQLDIDTAVSMYDMKGLNLKSNIENILPQVLAAQIDQYILSRYFEQAKNNVVGNWSSVADWDSISRVPVSLLYSDLGAFISVKCGEYTKRHGVVPNVILCSPLGYGILSVSEKFRAIDSSEKDYAGTPKVVGYYNNCKVILTNCVDSVGIVITYRGESDAQATGVFAPYIPVTLRTVDGAEGGGMITTTNAYSIAGFAMINPELIEGIVIN